VTDRPQDADALTGSCLCGGVRYEISGRIGPVLYCHCRMCRKAQGAAFTANAAVRLRHFRVVAGEALLSSYESSPQKWRRFCRVCGSPIYSHRASDPDVVRIRLGLLDRDPGRRPAAHLMVEHKAPWHRIDGDLPFLDASGEPLPEATRKKHSEPA
jgi:hypothetical protein